ncbi:hypothetical protein [Olleya marilimosa]|uniref:Lipoprotein n=1 Tax=Olleya marilimosa TaxID=272164 RepID=A0ABR8LWZ8_9FLAO|nr:hypothetical protein [Olleya marilimosa]MBD3862762.1 hypothetical protein [Olleya marilimosa]
MKKSTHYLLKLLVLTLFFNLTNCQNDDIVIDKVTSVTNTNKYIVKTVAKQNIFKNKPLLNKLESYKSKTANKNLSYNRIIHNDSLNIIIDDSNAMYVQNQDSTYHSYTFNALDVNNPDKIVNLLLSLEPDDTYKESILSYQLTESDINLLKQGLEVDFTNKIIYTELNKNTFSNTTGTANKIYYSGENCFDISTTVSRCCSSKHTYQDIQNGEICKCSEDEQPVEDFNVIITITSCGTSGGNTSNIPDFEYPHDPSNQIDGGAIDFNHQGTTAINNPNNAALTLMFNLNITDTNIADWLMFKKNRGAVESILDFLEDNNYSDEAEDFVLKSLEILSLPILSMPIAQTYYEEQILRMTNHLRQFGEIEDEIYADYIDSLILDFSTMTSGEVHDIYLQVKQTCSELTIKYLIAITTPIITDLVMPIITYALFEATAGTAVKILQKIPLSAVLQGLRLNKMVQNVAVLGVEGLQGAHIRELHGMSVSKASELFATLTKNAVSTSSPTNGIIVANMGNGNFITFRTVSGPLSPGVIATIDLNFSQLFSEIVKLKFYP